MGRKTKKKTTSFFKENFPFHLISFFLCTMSLHNVGDLGPPQLLFCFALINILLFTMHHINGSSYYLFSHISFGFSICEC